MKRIPLLLALAGIGTSVVTLLACSSDPDRVPFDNSTPDGDTANLPEAGPSSDVDVRDAAVDVRAPFEPTDEKVTCEVEPCAVDIVAGQNHFCALMSDKTIRCWGDDSVGSLGGGDSAEPSDPSDAGFVAGKVVAIADAVQISAGGTTTCALGASGAVSCWGGNDVGQLALTADVATSDWDRHATPAPIALEGNVARIDVGQRTACAVLASGGVSCWGANDQGQLARSLDTMIGAPAIVEGIVHAAQTAGATNTSFAVDEQGHVASWGAVAGIQGSTSGRIASSSPDLVPSTLASLDGVTSFAASPWLDYWPPFDGVSYPPERGIGHACAVSKGTLYCWGDSALGAMGVGIVQPVVRPTAVIVKSEAYPQRVAVSQENTCARLTDGTVQCAGDDSHGQLGRGADAGLFADFFVPATSLDGYALRVALATSTTCVIARGGKVFCWGGNEHGELGQGTTDTDSHPMPVSVSF